MNGRRLFVFGFCFLVVLGLYSFALTPSLEGNQIELIEGSPLRSPSMVGIEMTLSQNAYPANVEWIVATITNQSDVQIPLDEYYTIEYFTNNKWMQVPLEFEVMDIAYILDSEDEKDFRIHLYPEQFDYNLGLYRVRKSISIDGEVYDLVAEFNLV